MKTINRFYLCFLFLLIITFSACKNSNDPKPGHVDTPEIDAPTEPEMEQSIVEYRVPVDYHIPILSAGLDFFYSNCENPITLDLPEGWTEARISTSGAEVLASDIDPKKFIVIPIEKNCTLNCQAKTPAGILHKWTRDFKVISPPKPDIELTINGKIFDGLRPIPKTSRLVVRIVPNPDFKSTFPNDANYEISNVEVLAHLSLGSPTKVNSISTSGKDATKPLPIAMGTRVRQSRPGTKVIIKINDIYRTNFKKVKIIESFSERAKTMGVVVK